MIDVDPSLFVGRSGDAGLRRRRAALLVHLDTANLLRSIADPLGRTVSFGYDAAGRVTSETLPDLRQVSTTYDASGNVATLTPPGKTAHAFGYTPIELQQTYTPPDVPGDGTRSTSSTYNRDRQLTSSARPDARTVRPTWDAAKGRLNSLAWSAGTATFGYGSADASSHLNDHFRSAAR